MTTIFSLTARDIVMTALEDNAIIALGVAPKDKELSACLRRLDAMLKSWQAEGLEWKVSTIDVAGLADVATTQLPVDVQSVNGARYLESATNERMMTRFERDDYLTLPNKIARGVPTIYYVPDSEIETLEGDVRTITVWPVPAAAYTLKVDVVLKFNTIENANDKLDIPEYLSETIYTNLAVRCAGLYGREAPTELAARAAMLERKMLDYARPASYHMGMM